MARLDDVLSRPYPRESDIEDSIRSEYLKLAERMRRAVVYAEEDQDYEPLKVELGTLLAASMTASFIQGLESTAAVEDRVILTELSNLSNVFLTEEMLGYERTQPGLGVETFEGMASIVNRYVDELNAGVSGGGVRLVQGGILTASALARLDSFANSIRTGFWGGVVEQRAGIMLPAYPGQDSECGGWCKCSWNIDIMPSGTVLATWRLGTAIHCNTCIARANIWNPLVFLPGSGFSLN